MSIERISRQGMNMATPVQIEFPAAREAVPGGRKGPTDTKEPSPDLTELSNLVASVQRNLDVMHAKNLNFSVHTASGRTMVTVSDETTGKVVREIPSREMLNLSAKLEEMMGLIFDKKV